MEGSVYGTRERRVKQGRDVAPLERKLADKSKAPVVIRGWILPVGTPPAKDDYIKSFD